MQVFGPPRQRHAAAVAAEALATGSGERRVLAQMVGDADAVGQSQLFTLVEVGGAGQPQHEQGSGRCAAPAEVLVRLGIAGPDAVAVPRTVAVIAKPAGVPDDIMV